MPERPLLVLVDPRAQHRAAIRQRLLSALLGVLLAGASAVPLLLELGH
jgi:hypothetical protein